MNAIALLKSYANAVDVIQEWLGAGGVTVEQELAQKRADCCISCPLNVKSGIISEPIAKAIKSQMEIKNSLNLKVLGEKKLGRCQACFCETKLKIWIPLQNILPEPEERHKFDPKCWLLSESQ